MLVSLKVTGALIPNNVLLTLDKGLSIKGQVRELSIPFPCRVRLFDRVSGNMLFEVATDGNGFYEFDHLANATFFIVAHHPTLGYNALIIDKIKPK